ncbi:ATP-binding protein [Glaciecola siphonariae]|uniref:ATP-binding protein n=1 Tax=Glaciecola siphonariae TaxID=521012 RepID=A0ABV9LYT7_9ALTE
MIERFVENNLLEALNDTPVVLIHGSRQCGKTTLAQLVGNKLGYYYLTFDDANQLNAAKIDPVGFIDNLPEKVIIDEVQRAPEIFTSIKASVDKNRKPGRFILTGSSNVLLLPRLSDSLAGRIEVIHLRALSQAEIIGEQSSVMLNIFSRTLNQNIKTTGYTKLGKKLNTLITSGGYPSALNRTSENRKMAWYRDFINTLIQRDIKDIANIQNVSILPKLLQLCASQTARLFNVSDLAAPFSLSRPTIKEYITLLEQIFLVEQIQPWHTNRLSRLIKTPKLHLSDTGLACSLLNVKNDDLEKDRNLIGQLLETYVYQELRKYASWQDGNVDIYHFRNKDKVEVDFVIQDGRYITGVEVKASATIQLSDFKGLIKLRDALDDNFANGVVFYDGEAILSFGDRLFAIPYAAFLANNA